jgi:ABC-type glycerol-3-phosphate transport system permease component
VILYSIWVRRLTRDLPAGLGAIPGELFEAAKVDGAGRWAAFRKIISRCFRRRPSS